MKQILFVDDETNLLEGLRRMLRPMRGEWEMRFAETPERALEMLGEQAADAIVTDMRMPRMNGAELLAQARATNPGMARIILSGHSELEATLRSVGLAHQFLAKPCDADTLKMTVSRACELRTLLADETVAAAVCQIGTLPSLPSLYQAITAEMNREEASLKRIAAIIENDLAMTAKLLQLVNSAFFGLRRRVENIEQVVNYLGLDVIRALVVSNSAFESFSSEDAELFTRLWQHSSLTGRLAKTIAESACKDAIIHSESLQAGMLHDIGQLVLAAGFPERYQEVRNHAASTDRAQIEIERELLGCDHGSAGAYLLGLWGLPERVVEAIAYHHFPGLCAFTGFSPLTATHAASGLLHEVSGESGPSTELDLDYLTAVGCAEQIDKWRDAAARLVNTSGDQT
jgi:HD-like signal output (HDOD) protein